MLFRTNTAARPLVEKFMEYNIPFQMRDSLPNIYEHWIAQDLITYIHMAQGSRKRQDFLKIANRPKRYLSRDVLQDSEISFCPSGGPTRTRTGCWIGWISWRAISR